MPRFRIKNRGPRCWTVGFSDTRLCLYMNSIHNLKLDLQNHRHLQKDRILIRIHIVRSRKISYWV